MLQTACSRFLRYDHAVELHRLRMLRCPPPCPEELPGHGAGSVTTKNRLRLVARNGRRPPNREHATFDHEPALGVVACPATTVVIDNIGVGARKDRIHARGYPTGRHGCTERSRPDDLVRCAHVRRRRRITTHCLLLAEELCSAVTVDAAVARARRVVAIARRADP